VALDGIGGDALFQVSSVFLADLLAAGRWGELRREWRHHGARGGRRVRARSFVRQVALPALPPALLAAAGVLRGRALLHHRTRRVPAWLDARFARAHDLAELGVPETDRRPGESRAALESRWYLASGWSAAVLSFVSRLALAAGLEVRSPYYDRRVVAFAAARPREERRAGNETKRLVRAAVRGLLPDEVLAPRTHRTGTTAGYFVRTMQSELPGLMAHLRSFALADVGIVDADALRGAAARFLAHPRPDGEAGNLFFTLQTELWLRAQLGGGTPAASSMAAGDHGGVPRRTPAAPLGRG
jgi:asparagine synthase (glutamine-hydrolysing)